MSKGNLDRGLNDDQYPIVRLLSDYTLAKMDVANYLDIMLDINSDVHFKTVINNNTERGIRVAMSGTRYSNKFLIACQNFYFALLEEIQTTNRSDLVEINPYVKKDESYINKNTDMFLERKNGTRLKALLIKKKGVKIYG